MLGDLGVAKQLEGTLEYTISCLGTPYYMSPEVIASRPYQYASDVWSLGCVLHEIAARKTAFQSIGLPQLMYKIIKTDFEPLPHGRFSRPLQLLVNSMLRSDPADRPATRDIILIPFVRKHLGLLLGPSAARSVIESASAPASSSYDDLPSVSQADLLSTAMRGLKKEGLGGGSKKKISAQVAKKKKGALAADSSSQPSRVSSSALLPVASSATMTRKTPTPPIGASRVVQSTVSRASSSVSQATSVPVAAVKSARKIEEWASGALWERKVAKQAEARIKARQHDARLTREQARQTRKEKDPEHKAREAELAAIGEHLMEKKRKEVEGQRMARNEWLDIGEDVGGGTEGWGGHGEGMAGFFDEFGAWHEAEEGGEGEGEEEEKEDDEEDEEETEEEEEEDDDEDEE